MCITTNYCCPIPKGKHSDLTVGEYGGKWIKPDNSYFDLTDPTWSHQCIDL
jgi:hypothetical protein